MTRYRGFEGEVATLGELGITRRTLLNGERRIVRRYVAPTTTKITPTIAPTGYIAPHLIDRSTGEVVGRDPNTGMALPGWTESYCVPGSSVRTIINGISSCPMYFRGGTTAEVQETAMRELMEPETVAPADQEIEKKQYAEGGDGRAEILEKTAKIDEAIKRVTDGRVTTPKIPVAPPQAEIPALLPLAIGAALIFFLR